MALHRTNTAIWNSVVAFHRICALHFRRVDVIGRGYSGYNTRMCLQILPDLFPDEASVRACHWFTIFLGANDASLAEQHVPVNEFRSNLSKMIKHLQKLGISNDRITLISLPPVDENKWNARELAEGKPKNRILNSCPLYAQTTQDAAKECQVSFINLYEAMIAQQDWPQFFNDGLHFSRKGSEFLGQLLIKIFETRVLDECPRRLPDWKEVDKQDSLHAFDQYIQTFEAAK